VPLHSGREALVLKHVPEVTVARPAHDLHTFHAEGHVGLGDERALIALVERGPAAA
jgi:hypothetical protein